MGIERKYDGNPRHEGKMSMIWLKSCPRCEMGDVIVDRDIYGWNVLCLQCGYMKDLKTPSEAEIILDNRFRRKEAVAEPA